MGAAGAADYPALVVMGVSGAGKSTIAAAVAAQADALFLDADDFHPASNTAKMAAGTPLTDDDRWPWLRAVGDEIARRTAAGERVVMACSALKRSYRDVLRERGGDVCFALLDGSPELLAERIGARAGHFMPATLLGSQLVALQRLQPDEPGFTVAVDQTPEQISREVVSCWRDVAELGARRSRET
jgi:carbohydrate kinase (thermoresistant glucokinase family)